VASLPGLFGLLGMLGWASCATAPPAGAPAEKVSAAPSETTPPPSVPPVTQVGFETQILPILQAKCRPCHFEGGVMYTRLPFDCPQTVRFLGTKLFTRIKPEGEQSIINLFLAQSPGLDGETQKHCQIIGHN
jgi:hypothetical protein